MTPPCGFHHILKLKSPLKICFKLSENNVILFMYYPLDTRRKLNVHMTFRRRPGHLLNILLAFNSRSVPRGLVFFYSAFQNELFLREFIFRKFCCLQIATLL